jgi:hypothetical protein
MTNYDTVSARRTERPTLRLGRERLLGGAVAVVAAVVLLLAAQLHHWIASHDSDGATAEILPVLIGGALGWLVVFGAAFIPPHRSKETARTSRRYALGLGLFALPMVVLAYWTPIPWCLGAGSLLLLHRARTVSAPARLDKMVTGLAWIAITGPVLIFIGVIIAALS